MPEFEVLPDRPSMDARAAHRITDAARSAVAERGRFTVALSGGTTPASLYAMLARPQWRERIPWSQTHVFWGDERWVPPDDPTSNFGMARRALLDLVDIPPHQVHRIPTERTPVDAAAAYTRALTETVVDGSLDLVLLGIGEDGHTASLFPGSEAVKVHRRGALACHVQVLDAWRVTLTLSEINAARSVLFLVSGREKADAVAAVRRGEPGLPAARVLPASGDLAWVLDAETAAAARASIASSAEDPGHERAKALAGAHGARYAADGMVVGLGTGSTARHFVEALGRRLRDGTLRDIVGIATSAATERLAREEGIRLVSIGDRPWVDLTVDGADEVSPTMDLVKGLGGALVREKVVAGASRRMVVVADPEKLVDRLGTRSPLPVAVVPFGWRPLADALRALGAAPSLRAAQAGGPFVTDDGLYIVDGRFPEGIDDPAAIEASLAGWPGVAATGLFLGVAREAIVGDALGTWVHRPSA